MKSGIHFQVLAALIFLKTVAVNAQMENVEQISIFSSRLKNPVTLDVKTDRGNIYFNVINKSQYLYDFEI